MLKHISILTYATLLLWLSQSSCSYGKSSVLRKTTLPLVSQSYDYSIVLDAGSSGSRLWIYKWIKLTDLKELPQIDVVNSHKFERSLSTYVDDIVGLRQLIGTIIQLAQSYVPVELHNSTEIFVLATAGMRLLLDDKANDVIDSIRQILSNSSQNSFKFAPDYGARILSGEEEGAFSWITVNYLLGTFKDDFSLTSTHGMMEMGGASTQIAFIPSGSVLANKFPMRLKDQRYPLYVHSYLKYGLNYVEMYIFNRLKVKHNSLLISNPCLLKGDRFEYNSTQFIGTGNPMLCLDLLQDLVYKITLRRCNPKPCAIGSIYQPQVPLNMKFYVIGAFFPSLRDLKTLDNNGKFILGDVLSKSLAFCRKNFADLLVELPHLKKYLSKTCLSGLYTVLLFNKGYSIPMNATNLIAAEELNGNKISWTLGSVLYELKFNYKR